MSNERQGAKEVRSAIVNQAEKAEFLGSRRVLLPLHSNVIEGRKLLAIDRLCLPYSLSRLLSSSLKASLKRKIKV
jgi:hypothetical protein